MTSRPDSSEILTLMSEDEAGREEIIISKGHENRNFWTGQSDVPFVFLFTSVVY